MQRNRSDHIFEEFQRYLALSDDMVAMSSKEALARAARILAMQAAHYAAKYGEEPLIDLGSVLSADALGEAGATFLRDGAKTFVGVLGAVTGGLDRSNDTTLQ
ncbi:MAG TPA: hypothetical protein VL550_00910 [Rhodocyclaceae bacterium]|jgi:hypothetical protein|nr:hypothetical protein [Rhodocyclaceae bacterium]